MSENNDNKRQMLRNKQSIDYFVEGFLGHKFINLVELASFLNAFQIALMKYLTSLKNRKQ